MVVIMKIKYRFYLKHMFYVLFVLLVYCTKEHSLAPKDNPWDINGDNYIENKTSFANTGNDTIVSIKDTLQLKVKILSSFTTNIKQIEWNIFYSGFNKVSSYDTNIIAPSKATPKYLCILKVTADYECISFDTMYVNVKDDPPVVVAETTTPHVRIDSTIELSGIATDSFGTIEKYEWKFGNNNWVTTSTADTNIIAPSSLQFYPCSLRVTDDDGMTCTDVVTILIMGKVTDIEGNEYNTMRIGDQIWTRENLRTTKYNDNTDIPYKKGDAEWNACTTGIGAYCFYNNYNSSKEIYGMLYNLFAVTSGKLAPEGWHVSTYQDWALLVEYLINNGYNWDGSNSDNKIGKAIASQTYWTVSNKMGHVGGDCSTNNSTGFTALPGGHRIELGNFYWIRKKGYWWSPNLEEGNMRHHITSLIYDEEFIRLGTALDYHKGYGFYVRLVKD